MPAGIYRDSGFPACAVAAGGMSAPVPCESGLPFASHGVTARNAAAVTAAGSVGVAAVGAGFATGVTGADPQSAAIAVLSAYSGLTRAITWATEVFNRSRNGFG